MMGEGQDQSKIAQKRIKFEEIMEEKGGEYAISALPDCLLIEILSRLPDTKDAIKTGTLSKRWERLWTFVPALIFEPSPQCLQNLKPKSDFALLVSKTLTQCPQLKRKKFQVHTKYDIRFESQFNDWIRYAISCNVEELILSLWGSEAEFVLDQDVFISSCFTNLRLEGCQLNPTGAISWENLRSLSISKAIIDEELLVNIVSGTPLLETLVLEYCVWPDITSDDDDDISAPTSFSLAQCRQLEHLKKFKMDTTTRYGIKFQSQLNNWIHYAIRCNVQELNLTFWNGYEDDFVLDQFVFTASCFTELRLEGCMLNPDGAISWKHLRSLCISKVNVDEDLIENILYGSPVLETLVLNDCYGYRRLDITSKSVKNLVLGGLEEPYDEYEAHIIEINAPNILSLSIKGEFLCKPLLLNVSSLVGAYLNYTCTKFEHRHTTPTEAEQEMLKGFIMKLRHVKDLELGFFCAKVLSCLQDKGFVAPSNVKLDRGW